MPAPNSTGWWQTYAPFAAAAGRADRGTSSRVGLADAAAMNCLSLANDDGRKERQARARIFCSEEFWSPPAEAEAGQTIAAARSVPSRTRAGAAIATRKSFGRIQGRSRQCSRLIPEPPRSKNPRVELLRHWPRARFRLMRPIPTAVSRANGRGFHCFRSYGRADAKKTLVGPPDEPRAGNQIAGRHEPCARHVGTRCWRMRPRVACNPGPRPSSGREWTRAKPRKNLEIPGRSFGPSRE